MVSTIDFDFVGDDAYGETFYLAFGDTMVLTQRGGNIEIFVMKRVME